LPLSLKGFHNKARGYAYFTPLGYIDKLPAVKNTWPSEKNHQTKKRLNQSSRQSLPFRPWVVPGNNASE